VRATVDIPDPQYRRLEAKAANEGTSVPQIILQIVDRELGEEVPRPVTRAFPVIHSERKDKLVIDSESIYDLIGFP
jgi:hypothetical protein